MTLSRTLQVASLTAAPTLSLGATNRLRLITRRLLTDISLEENRPGVGGATKRNVAESALHRHLTMSMSLVEALELHLPRGYVVQGKLGGGATSIVYLAGVPGSRRERLAVKVLLPGATTAQSGNRFLREMQVLEKLDHPHIPRILEPGEANGSLFFTMPYIDGETLGERLRRSGQLPILDSLLIARDIGDALEHAHSRGVVHRDVKPDNIFVANGSANLLDFGLAIASDSVCGSGMEWDGLIVGTPSYMSPEQASGTRADGWRSDFFSLGCVLYEMLSGQQAFASSSIRETMQRHRDARVPDVRALRPDVPEDVAGILRRSLHADPSSRYPTARFLRRALEAAIEAFEGIGNGSYARSSPKALAS
jgi:eukaryotic-like serine/threonine-protein kinase